MDETFRSMLIQAEKIRAECRRTGDIYPHTVHLKKMLHYGLQRGLFTGSILRGTASAEKLVQAAEMVACAHEVFDGEFVGSVLCLSEMERYKLVLDAGAASDIEALCSSRS